MLHLGLLLAVVCSSIAGCANDDSAEAVYTLVWQDEFDYVLVILADAVPDLPAFLPERLEPVSATGMAALFRVRPSVMQAHAARSGPLPRQPRPCGFS